MCRDGKCGHFTPGYEPGGRFNPLPAAKPGDPQNLGGQESGDAKMEGEPASDIGEMTTGPQAV